MKTFYKKHSLKNNLGICQTFKNNKNVLFEQENLKQSKMYKNIQANCICGICDCNECICKMHNFDTKSQNQKQLSIYQKDYVYDQIQPLQKINPLVYKNKRQKQGEIESIQQSDFKILENQENFNKNHKRKRYQSLRGILIQKTSYQQSFKNYKGNNLDQVFKPQNILGEIKLPILKKSKSNLYGSFLGLINNQNQSKDQLPKIGNSIFSKKFKTKFEYKNKKDFCYYDEYEKTKLFRRSQSQQNKYQQFKGQFETSNKSYGNMKPYICQAKASKQKSTIAYKANEKSVLNL